jgi:hypothetical protein
MSTTPVSKRPYRVRSVDLPAFNGSADRLGPGKTVKKRKQASVEADHLEPRRKKPRSGQNRSKRTSEQSRDKKPQNDRLSSRSVVVRATDEPEQAQAEVKLESIGTDTARPCTLTDLPVEASLKSDHLAYFDFMS